MSIAQTEPLTRFIEAHPLRISLDDGTQLRFRDMVCACRSAAFHHRGLWDESRRRGLSYAECVQLANAADRTARE